MGLLVVNDFDVETLWTGGNYPSTGVSFNNTAAGNAKPFFYYDRLDFFAAAEANPSPPAGEEWIRWDPLLLANTGTLFKPAPGPADISAAIVLNVTVGEWDKSANTQKTYAYSASSLTGHTFNEVSPLSLGQYTGAGLDVFPNLGTRESNGISSGTAGYYNDVNGWWHFFETWGYALVPNCDVRDAGNVNRVDVMAQVDLTTGYATILDIPIKYTSTIANSYQESALFGQEVVFKYMQFVQDDNSTPASPRGALYFFSQPTDNPADTTHHRAWMKVVDWNPNDVAGTPSRVHIRERLLTAVDIEKGAQANTGGYRDGGATTNLFWMYHPRTNRPLLYSTDPIGAQLSTLESKFLFFSSAPGLDSFTEPSATEIIATGKTVSFAVEALGTLLEPIGGINFQFTLENVSTVDEAMTIVPTTPGQSVSTAFGIDPEDPNASPVIVNKSGVPLTETTHYTVDFVGDAIDFVGPEPNDIDAYTVTYRHFEDPGTNPHGVLQNEFSSSGIDGLALARVEYAEEASVEDKWDKLTAVEV